MSALDPLHEGRALSVGDTDPSGRVLRAFPDLLPSSWHGVSHKLSSFSLGLRSKHLLSLKDSSNRGNARVHGLEERSCALELHVDKLLYRVTDSALCDTDISVGLVSLIDVLPQLTDGAESFSPLFFIESDFASTD